MNLIFFNKSIDKLIQREKGYAKALTTRTKAIDNALRAATGMQTVEQREHQLLIRGNKLRDLRARKDRALNRQKMVNRGVTGAVGQSGQNAIGLLGYHAVTGEPLYGTAVPQGTGQYGGVPPVGGSALDVIQAGGPAGAQRLTTLKNAQTMADALNAYLPTVRKFSEQAKKDDFERNMASAGIKQNILTNAAMLQAAQAAGLGMGLQGATQAGQALTQQYNY